MIRLTRHAAEMIEQRGIALAWVELAASAPDRREPDPSGPPLVRSYKAIAEAGGRVLRVVHRPAGDDTLIVTAHFDRGAKP